MGEYELEEERVNEFPLYKKADESHYLYRATSGKWMITNEKESIANNAGAITARAPALLPTSEGVAWNHWDGKAWVADDAISAIDLQVRWLSDRLPEPPYSTDRTHTD